jgi:hypothetical protein
MTIDTTICSNWAGGSAQSGCPGTCSDMVASANNYVGKFDRSQTISHSRYSVIDAEFIIDVAVHQPNPSLSASAYVSMFSTC